MPIETVELFFFICFSLFFFLVVICITEYLLIHVNCFKIFAFCRSTHVCTFQSIGHALAIGGATAGAITRHEFQKCLWCRFAIHPVNGQLIIIGNPSMLLRLWNERIPFQTLSPYECLIVCPFTVLLQRVSAWW